MGKFPKNVFLCALEVVLSKIPSPTRCEGYSLTCGQMIEIQTLHQYINQSITSKMSHIMRTLMILTPMLYIIYMSAISMKPFQHKTASYQERERERVVSMATCKITY